MRPSRVERQAADVLPELLLREQIFYVGDRLVNAVD